MGIAYRFVAPAHCSFVVWHGEVSPDQWNLHFDKFANDPAFPDCPRSLIDMSTVGGIEDITDDVIREMATRWRSREPKGTSFRWAIIPNGEWNRARKFEVELEASGIQTMLFNNAETASVWLGVDPEQGGAIIRELRQNLRGPDHQPPSR